MARVLVNKGIVASEVAVVDEDGHDLAVMPRKQALALAADRGYDLVQESSASSPPHCRLIPASGRQARAARAARLAAGDTPKEIRVSTAMGAHDVETRLRQAAGLLARGYTVKVSARLAKAERAKPVASRALLESLAREMDAQARVVRPPFNESGALSLLLAPRDD